MDQRSALRLQVLEKLGAPLMASIVDIARRQGGAADPRLEAERMAELLSRAVQASIPIGKAMDLRDDDGQADSVRLGLAALAGSLIAGQYRLSGRIPEEGDITRMVAALEAVLAFAENFSPAADNIARLKALEPGLVPYDENQVNILYFCAFAPLVSDVAAFSFGRPEKKLMQEIAAKVTDRAKSLRVSLLPGTLTDQQARQAELTLLGPLVSIYRECHKAETERLLAMDEKAREEAAQGNGGTLPMDPVWNAFEVRTAMLETLGVHSGPGAQAAASSLSPAAAVPPPVFTAPPASAAIAPPASEQAPPPAAGGGPMSFFKPGAKKTDSDDQSTG